MASQLADNFDPAEALLLAADRLAHVACGHVRTCDCGECMIVRKRLGADRRLKRVVEFLHVTRDGRAVLLDFATTPNLSRLTGESK